ncbi:MAG: putative transposase [Anaerophaga sp.]|jgi:transposase-like protein|nr:putative transposase [Anaerophaga sp.]
MSRGKRKFELEEKIQILREEENYGVEVTCCKYQIAPSLFYSWKNRFDRHGPDGLTPKHHRVDPQVKALEKENDRLGKIISRQAIEQEVKEELLKKTKPHYR